MKKKTCISCTVENATVFKVAAYSPEYTEIAQKEGTNVCD